MGVIRDDVHGSKNSTWTKRLRLIQSRACRSGTDFEEICTVVELTNKGYGRLMELFMITH